MPATDRRRLMTYPSSSAVVASQMRLWRRRPTCPSRCDRQEYEIVQDDAKGTR